MNRETVFQIWAPPQGVWSLWARPILFAQMHDWDCERLALESLPPADTDTLRHAIAAGGMPAARRDEWQTLDIAWAKSLGDGVLFVIDLPGEESVRMGLALAGGGFRPVPLYNACCGTNEVIEQEPIMAALLHGTAYLARLALANDAPPAFLLDANRMRPKRPLTAGAFDNRWQVFPQDFPSGGYLTGHGFTRAVLVVRGDAEPARDLAHVLRRWQEAGLRIEMKDLASDRPPQPIDVNKPFGYRSVWHRLLAIFGLRPALQGGFGSVIPEPSKSHG